MKSRPTLKELLMADALRADLDIRPRGSARRRPTPSFDFEEVDECRSFAPTSCSSIAASPRAGRARRR
jgi:hypothetical protein